MGDCKLNKIEDIYSYKLDNNLFETSPKAFAINGYLFIRWGQKILILQSAYENMKNGADGYDIAQTEMAKTGRYGRRFDIALTNYMNTLRGLETYVVADMKKNIENRMEVFNKQKTVLGLDLILKPL